MEMNALLIEKAEELLNQNKEVLEKNEIDICNIGCEFCANCSGIVGG